MIERDVVDCARATRIESLAAENNIKLRGRGNERCGPCPICGGTDRFAINKVKQVFLCRGCETGGDVIALAMFLHGCSFRDAVAHLVGEQCLQAPPHELKQHDTNNYQRRQAQKANWLWSQRQPIAGSPAERYLRQARGYFGPIPETLAFLPPRKSNHHPALIAPFSICAEPEPGVLGDPVDVDAVHLTLLRADGSGKADIEANKLTIGRPLGRPIALASANDLGGLVITEGIEDGLSVYAATQFGTWAAGAAPFMPALADTVPDHIETITIYAHDDPTGERECLKLATALDRRGFEVRIEGLEP